MTDEVQPSRPSLDEYHMAVGRIATASARFELMVSATIWELADVMADAGACITAHIGSPSARFRALVALVRLRGGSEARLRELNSIGEKADALGRQRNRFIHDSVFSPDPTSELFHRFEITADRHLRFGPQAHDLGDMQKLVD